MSAQESTLIYIADPMCAWCWGFRQQLREVRQQLGDSTGFALVLGGLAPDTDMPMPEPTRQRIQGAWRAVAERTGAQFNWGFWEDCEPRRSTYRACRAVLAAAQIHSDDAGLAMFEAIQRAYYEEARNPSNRDTLIDLARELDPALDADRFAEALDGNETQARLDRDLELCRQLGTTGFPSLALRHAGAVQVIQRGWGPTAPIIARTTAILSPS